jgi:hypothetical protein
MMSQQDAALILFVASLFFTIFGNGIVSAVNARRVLKHELESKVMLEMIEIARANSKSKKKPKKMDMMIEVGKPNLVPRFSFWIVLIMTVAAYSVLAALV